MSAPNVITVENLTKVFDSRCVVDKISLDVKQGEVFGFLGPNGSGKTTTIRMLCGLLLPDGGSGTCLQYDIKRDSDLIKRATGYMPQRFSYYEKMTVYENMQFVASLRDNVSKVKIKKIMADFGLDQYKHTFAGRLSGGWKQRLSLAACLLHRPKLLLLDEPTAGVDPESRRYFWDVIHDLADQGTTVLVTTHYMDEAERCSRLAFISQGKLTNTGSRDEIINDAGMHTFSLIGHNLYKMAKDIEKQYPKILVVVFGNSIHLSTKDKALPIDLIEMIQSHSSAVDIHPTDTTIEHIFIDMVRKNEAN